MKDEGRHIWMVKVFNEAAILCIQAMCEVFESTPEERSALYKASQEDFVGWYDLYRDAEKVVLNNVCDIHECTYDYACIYPVQEGLYPHAEAVEERWFRYDPETDTYRKTNHIAHPNMVFGL